MAISRLWFDGAMATETIPPPAAMPLPTAAHVSPPFTDLNSPSGLWAMYSVFASTGSTTKAPTEMGSVAADHVAPASLERRMLEPQYWYMTSGLLGETTSPNNAWSSI